MANSSLIQKIQDFARLTYDQRLAHDDDAGINLLKQYNLDFGNAIEAWCLDEMTSGQIKAHQKNPSGVVDNSIKKFAEDLEKHFGILPIYTGPIFRREWSTENEIRTKYVIQSSFAFGTFVSFSTHDNHTYGDNKGDQIGILFRVEDNRNGRLIGCLAPSTRFVEYEVLVSKNTSYFVDRIESVDESIRWQGYEFVVHLTEV